MHDVNIRTYLLMLFFWNYMNMYAMRSHNLLAFLSPFVHFLVVESKATAAAASTTNDCRVVSYELTWTKIKINFSQYFQIFALSFSSLARSLLCVCMCVVCSPFFCVHDKPVNLNTFRSMWIYFWNFKIDSINRTFSVSLSLSLSHTSAHKLKNLGWCPRLT